MHVLLIEPDKVLADTYTQTLRAAGHTVAAVSSAQDGVHAADEQLPDVVVLELQLPGHNGIEFLYEFRSYSEWLQVPIIVHSFVPPAELTGTILQRELGVVAVLHKPETNLAQLRAAVQSLAPVSQP